MIDDIYNSATGFANALDRLAEQAGDQVDDVVRKTTIDLSTKIVKDTPVDTGRARAAWILTKSGFSSRTPSEGEYPAYQNDNPPESEDPGISAIGKYYLANNLEYISVLEDGMPGGSRQAPNGMVANALNVFEQYLNSQINSMDLIE